VPGETYDWSVPVISPGGSINGATAGTGQSSVAQTLVNNTNTVTATATYVVTTSEGTSFNVVVTVYPNPVIAPQIATICSGSPFNIVPANVPGNTTYTWSAPAINPPGSITGGSAQAAPQLFIGQTLTNPTTGQATATYTVTPVAGSCSGNPFLVTVNVNPKPVLNNSGASPLAICSGTTYSYTPTSATASTSISWARAVVAGINNVAGSGTNNPNEILNNTTAPPAAVTVNYVFTLSANGCSNTQTIPLVVNPKPVLSSAFSAPTICSGNMFSYTPAASLASSPTFTWTRAAVAGINAGVSGSGNGNVNEILTNSTTNSIFVFYAYTITDGVSGCQSIQQFVSVLVNPAPVDAGTTLSSCSGNTFSYIPATVPSATLYSWIPTVISGNVTGQSAASGQFFVGQKLTNVAGQSVVDYLVTPSNNSCTGGSFHVVVTVTNVGGSVPSVSNANGLNACSGNLFTYTPQSLASGPPSYTWARFFTNGISPVNNTTGNTTINEVLTNSSTIPLVANYAIKTTDNITGCSNTDLIQVPVNPLASLTSGTSPLPICNNTVFNYTPSSNIANTTFTWSRAAIGTNVANSGMAI
jgi:hypothetical protein